MFVQVNGAVSISFDFVLFPICDRFNLLSEIFDSFYFVIIYLL